MHRLQASSHVLSFSMKRRHVLLSSHHEMNEAFRNSLKGLLLPISFIVMERDCGASREAVSFVRTETSHLIHSAKHEIWAHNDWRTTS